MSKRLLRTTVCAVLAAAALLAGACSGETVESKYSNYRASFTFNPVTSAPPLQGALNGYGEFCTINADANFYYFVSLTSTAKVDRTASSVYSRYVCIGGFIVGRAALNELGSADYPLVCFDRVCPNCWSNDNIARAMTIEQGGRAVCRRCSRTYDMNNGGVIVAGNRGKKLIRYRMSYGQNTLAINN